MFLFLRKCSNSNRFEGISLDSFNVPNLVMSAEIMDRNFLINHADRTKQCATSEPPLPLHAAGLFGLIPILLHAEITVLRFKAPR